MDIDKDWCVKMAAREGDAEISAGSPLHPLRQAEPDWPPASTAVGEPEGTRRYGSTGQLFEVRGQRWVRVASQQ